MYDYTALVDAPVQRFTGIVTGSDPDDERIAIAPLTPPPSVVVPVAETPLIVVAAEPPDAPEPRDAPEPPAAFETSPAEPVLPAEPVTAIVDGRADAVPRTATRATTRTATLAATGSRPSILPALAGIAAVGITAMWWLRRESHDR
jgi:LPXTG-motif cell wall-anchored protein